MIYEVSENGLALIKEFEGCRLEAYQDSVGVWTIGYGSTIGVKPGMVITQDQADARLKLDAANAVACVNRKVGPALTQNQFNALVSFVFNLGCAALAGSTLLRLINAGELAAAANEFPKWCHAGAQILPGLVARRETEQKLFLTP